MELKLKPLSKSIYTFLNKKLHFDQITNELIVVKAMNFGYRSSFQSLDKGIIERAGATGFTASIFSLGSSFFNFHSGA
jgi:hypothetical protein